MIVDEESEQERTRLGRLGAWKTETVRFSSESEASEGIGQIERFFRSAPFAFQDVMDLNLKKAGRLTVEEALLDAAHAPDDDSMACVHERRQLLGRPRDAAFHDRGSEDLWTLDPGTRGCVARDIELSPLGEASCTIAFDVLSEQVEVCRCEVGRVQETICGRRLVRADPKRRVSGADVRLNDFGNCLRRPELWGARHSHRKRVGGE